MAPLRDLGLGAAGALCATAPVSTALGARAGLDVFGVPDFAACFGGRGSFLPGLSALYGALPLGLSNFGLSP